MLPVRVQLDVVGWPILHAAASESEGAGSETGSDWEGDDEQPHTDPKKFDSKRKQHYNMREQLRRARELLAHEDEEGDS